MPIEAMKPEDKIIALNELKTTNGWRIVEEILQIQIDDLNEKLLNDEFSFTPEEEKLMKAKRKDRILLKRLPDDLIEEWSEKRGEDMNKLDPYA